MTATAEEVVRGTFVESDEGRPWSRYMAPDFRMHGSILGAIAPPDGLDREQASAMMDVAHRTRLLDLRPAPDGRIFTEIALSRDASPGRGSAQIVYALWRVRDGLVTELRYAEKPDELLRDGFGRATRVCG